VQIARVIGSTISTIKDDKVKGSKLLLVQDSDHQGKQLLGIPYVAVDLVDSGEGDLVLTCHGSAARQTNLTKDCPVDAVIMGVLDSLYVDGKVSFQKA
jgi:microcompartment protein CcmK/EutM